MGSYQLDSLEWSEANGVTVLVIVLLPALELCLMPLGTTVLDVIVGIEISIDTVTGVTAQGLINRLVDITKWSAVSVSWY